MYAYAANNPVKYTDPDGRIIDTSELNETDLMQYEKATATLKTTARGNELISKLEISPVKFTIKTNREAQNNYSPRDKTINWDPTKSLYTTEDAELKPELLLAHEMGHAEQDMNRDLPLNFTEDQRLDIEHLNIKNTEHPIAIELGQGQRKNYDDWKYSINSKGVVNNSLYIRPFSSATVASKVRARELQIQLSLLRTKF